MTEISVIVPVYKVEKYLKKCVDSILAQTFTDFELWLVDDGSPDNCGAICDAYAQKDSRVKVIHKKNGGAASARNAGISRATGSYIAFIDSDDYIGNEYLERLADQIKTKHHTIIQCGMTLVRENSQMLLSHQETVCNQKEYAQMVVSRRIPIFLFQTTVSKLYNRCVIVENNILFDEQVSLSEDCLFNTQLMPFVTSYCYIDGNSYFYNQSNGESLTHKKIQDFNGVFESIKARLTTSSIRYQCILKNQMQSDPEINKGFQKSICIIYLSNAKEIEEANLTAQQRTQLYDMYFSQMNYPIGQSIKEFSGTDRRLLNASKNKDQRTIHRIYKLRQYKKRILSFLRG